MKEAYKQNDIDDFKRELILKSALAQYPHKLGVKSRNELVYKNKSKLKEFDNRFEEVLN
ncbi:TPA: hypothetical protein KOS81_001411 [Clostridioides difficile]|nr:hypothetical protein [Clostridioides difficile]HBF6274483.1 hypothetical protein [Clostridioides difficile]HBY3544815.1 hypothetical protein [Clostridioides difficile]HBY3547533.1 hypothetical protein [Clostridioides difficile]